MSAPICKLCRYQPVAPRVRFLCYLGRLCDDNPRDWCHECQREMAIVIRRGMIQKHGRGLPLRP